MNEFLFSKLKSATRWWCTFPLIVVAFLFVGQSSYAQPITGIVPVQTPLGGSGVDGDAMAHTPAGYEDVGDLFDGVHLTGTHGVLDLTTGTLLYPGFTFFLQDPYNDDVTTFTSSNKINDNPNTYTWGFGSSPDKNEIQNAGAHFSYGSPALGGSATDLWVLFAGDREVTNGSSYIDFEFLQKSLTMTGAIATPVNPQTGTSTITGGSGAFVSEGTDGGRTVGDVLLTIEFQQGGGDAVISIRKWLAVGDGFEYVVQDNSLYTGQIFITQNTVETSVPFDVYGTNPGTYAVNQWAEGAANLSALFAEDPCFSVSTLFIRTRSSGNSSQSELKDFPGMPIQLTVNNVPTVTVNSPVRCSDGPAAIITATPDPMGTYTFDWNVPEGVADPGNVASFQATVAGTYSVTITNTLGCQASGSGELTIDPPATANAGDNQTVCSNAPAVTLNGSVGGGATSGTWSGGTGTFDPNPTTLNAVYTPSAAEITAGTVTLTLTTDDPLGPCGTDDDTMTITINHQPNAGTDGNTTVCDSSVAPINLFSLINGEEAGGTWTRTSGTGGTFNSAGGTYTPAPGATTSTFTYTLVGTAPCVNDSSIATVNINPQPNAGTDGSTTVCESSVAVINLFTLITGEQAGGTWTRTTGTGGTFNAAAGTFTPALDATNSTFTYTLVGTAPCINDTSVATVNINAQPNAGTDGNTTVCDSSTDAINLFSLISGEDLGGTWTRTSGTGGTFNAAAGTYTPAPGATTSTFTYTLTATEPCVGDSSVATVNINAQPNAGTDGSTTVCESSVVAINLFSLISGEQAGGTWTRTSGTGGTFNAAAGTFTPALDATTSTFTYTLLGVAPCINDTSVATVNINGQPNAGTDGNTTVCDSSIAAINLFSLISGEDVGGTWTRTSGTGGTFNAAAGTYTPAPGATTSTFTYTLTATEPCVGDSSVATVNINAQPNAGTDGSTTVCETSALAIDLNGLISGEQPGGTWTRTSGTGGTFNAAAGTYTPAIDATTSTFTYTLIGAAPCVNDTSVATVNINNQPNAGADGNTTVCATSPDAVNLFSLITGEDAGGTWTRTSGTGGTFNAAAGTFTPASGATNSTFTYTLTATAPCVNDSSVATVNITQPPTATISYGGPYCNDLPGLQTVTLMGTGAYLGGTFSSTAGLTINPTTGAINPDTSTPGTYTVTYTIAAAGGCAAVTATGVVVIQDCGMEGCTLGYWKNHIDRWCPTYSSTTIYGSVFTNAPSALASLTFLQVLNLGGGGIYNLGRQSVAAILNACSAEVAYPAPYGDSPQSVINAVNAAFLAGGTAPGTLATALDILNNTGCPLNGTAATRLDHNSGFTIYPVPFKENLTVHYDFDYKTDIKIEIMNLIGKVLMEYEAAGVSGARDIVLTPDFPVGDGQVYFVRMTTDRGVTIKKVISSK